MPARPSRDFFPSGIPMEWGTIPKSSEDFGKVSFYDFARTYSMAFGTIASEADKRVTEKFGLPLSSFTKCPQCGVEGKMSQIIAHLNNIKEETINHFDKINGCHGWTFKQIGEWLRDLGY